ncbi:hypothetical protein JCM10450v2_007268, partial [Rhodotorula kratochvilovae]
QSESSSPTRPLSFAAPHERTSLLPRAHEPRAKSPPASGAGGGGTILGLHNLAIVLPQFFVALVAAGIFRLTARVAAHALSGERGGGGGGELGGEDDVVWVLRFGGLASALGVVASRWTEETPSERRYKEWVLYGWHDAREQGDAERGRGSEEGSED